MEYRSHDPLADVSDAELLRAPEPLKSTTSVSLAEAHELFKFDRYVWEGFKPDYAVVMLTKGYFAIVDKENYKKVSKFKWRANVQIDPKTGEIKKVYALANMPMVKGKREFVYLHRFVTKAGACVIIDHKFGLTLDCREEALKGTDEVGNHTNARHAGRSVHIGLKRGVVLRRRGTRYGAVIRIKGKSTRAKKTWPLTPEGHEAAHKWYLRRHREAHSHRGLPELGAKAKYPVFPPLKKDAEILLIEAIPALIPAGTAVQGIEATF